MNRICLEVIMNVLLLFLIFVLFSSPIDQAYCATTIDDDTALGFYWDAAKGNVSKYNVYLSTNGGGYVFVGFTSKLPTISNPYPLPIVASDGSTYQIKVAAVDPSGVIGPISLPSEPVLCQLKYTMSKISAKTTLSASPNAWNLVGPSVITLDKSIVNNFGPGFGITWVAWRWNPTLSRWETPAALGGSPVTTEPFDAGTSWLYARDGNGLYKNENIQGTPVDTCMPFSASLKIGWNLICNPFDFPVVWSDSIIKIKYGGWEGTPTQAQTAGYVDNRAIWYNPDTNSYVTRFSYEATPYVMPMTRGQWLYSAVNGAYVVFPPIPYKGGLSGAPSSERKNDLSLWKIELTVRSKQGSDSIKAIADRIGRQYNLYDLKQPSLPISRPTISFTGYGDALSCDRQMLSDEMTWTFEASIPEESSLTWNLMDVPEDYKLTLEDSHVGKYINIRQMRKISLDKGEYRYTLKATRILPPKVTRLLANYPNPFNPETWIPYELSSNSGVVIKIYSSIGSLVRTLDLGQKSAGFYTAKDKAAYWDGKNESGEQVASGIYFYTIKINDFSATNKMVLLK